MVERVRAVHRRTHSRDLVLVSTCVPLCWGGTLNQFKKKKKKKELPGAGFNVRRCASIGQPVIQLMNHFILGYGEHIVIINYIN